ncbi:hypothetical protein GCM10011404_26410 [Sphingomonas prati]|nr:hypothetical protein GCM10011404_26410 [Sphingomonas prati]
MRAGGDRVEDRNPLAGDAHAGGADQAFGGDFGCWQHVTVINPNLEWLKIRVAGLIARVIRANKKGPLLASGGPR